MALRLSVRFFRRPRLFPRSVSLAPGVRLSMSRGRSGTPSSGLGVLLLLPVVVAGLVWLFSR